MLSLTRRSLAVLGLLLALPVGAQQGAAVKMPAQTPDAVIKSTTDQLQDLISKNKATYEADKAAFYKVVDELVVPRFDTKYIAQLILARNWRGATPEQRSRFEVAFKNMLIRTYADTMLEYSSQVKAEIKPLRLDPKATDVTVNTNVLRTSGPPIPVGFSLHVVDGEWKIWDISVENISVITAFRSQIAAEVKTSSLDAVIQKLEAGQAIRPVTEG